MPATPAATKQDKYRIAAQWDNSAVLQAEARTDCHRNPTGSLTTTHRKSATQNPSLEDTARGTTQRSSQTPVIDTQHEEDTREEKLCQADELSEPSSRKPSDSPTAGRIMPATATASKQGKFRAGVQWDSTTMLQTEARAEYQQKAENDTRSVRNDSSPQMDLTKPPVDSKTAFKKAVNQERMSSEPSTAAQESMSREKEPHQPGVGGTQMTELAQLSIAKEQAVSSCRPPQNDVGMSSLVTTADPDVKKNIPWVSQAHNNPTANTDVEKNVAVARQENFSSTNVTESVLKVRQKQNSSTVHTEREDVVLHSNDGVDQQLLQRDYLSSWAGVHQDAEMAPEKKYPELGIKQPRLLVEMVRQARRGHYLASGRNVHSTTSAPKVFNSKHGKSVLSKKARTVLSKHAKSVPSKHTRSDLRKKSTSVPSNLARSAPQQAGQQWPQRA